MSLDSRNDELNKKIDATDLPAAVSILIEDAEKRHRQLSLLRWLTFFSFVALAAIAFLLWQTHNIAAKAESNTQAIYARCVQTNEARDKNVKLWDHILKITEGTPRTAEQQKERDDFIQVKNETFAHTDCNKVMEK